MPRVSPSLVRDKLLPDAGGACYRCKAKLPGGAEVVMVPAAWVLGPGCGLDGAFLLCTSCPPPDPPPSEPTLSPSDRWGTALTALGNRLVEQAADGRCLVRYDPRQDPRAEPYLADAVEVGGVDTIPGLILVLLGVARDAGVFDP
jgi:hypothetical protein